MIRDNHKNHISLFNADDIEMYYKLPKGELVLHKKWLSNFKIMPKEVLKTWWTNKGTFKSKWTKEYPANLLKTSF